MKLGTMTALAAALSISVLTGTAQASPVSLPLDKAAVAGEVAAAVEGVHWRGGHYWGPRRHFGGFGLYVGPRYGWGPNYAYGGDPYWGPRRCWWRHGYRVCRGRW